MSDGGTRVTSNLEGKVAVVTGGSSGLGLATTKRPAEAGAYVFIMGRRQSTFDETKAEIGERVSAVLGDVANLDDLDTLHTAAENERGGLDIVVASAGFVERVLTLNARSAHFDKTFGINVRRVYLPFGRHCH
jgi:NAD(P)-dependent dehydrogenase (short-subunit alcohol dehydrogenase family)